MIGPCTGGRAGRGVFLQSDDLYTPCHPHCNPALLYRCHLPPPALLSAAASARHRCSVPLSHCAPQHRCLRRRCAVLIRGGAVLIEGAERVSLEACDFVSLGGNGACVSRYARNVTLSGCEFAWLGDSGLVVLGAARFADATDGNHPRGTLVEDAVFREVGVRILLCCVVL